MIIIDAIWEKRNLGIDVIEVEIEQNDNLVNVREQISKLHADYISVKVPVQCSDVLVRLQQDGYRYREDLVAVRHDLNETVRNRIHQRLYDSVSYHVMDELELHELKMEIAKGMFSTDRFSEDDTFTTEQCCNRYINWVSDLLEKNAHPYVMSYKNENIGFVILKEKEDGGYISVLGGGYEKYRKSGLGMVQKEQEITKMLGGKYVETNVSTNNISQFRALIENGYVPVDIRHVLVMNNL